MVSSTSTPAIAHREVELLSNSTLMLNPEPGGPHWQPLTANPRSETTTETRIPGGLCPDFAGGGDRVSSLAVCPRAHEHPRAAGAFVSPRAVHPHLGEGPLGRGREGGHQGERKPR